MACTVSVIIPTRNRSRLLKRTVSSVRSQYGVALEVIVVDDGSSDNTVEMIRGMNDARITIVGEPISRGVSAARNRGVRLATGEWIAFLDDDDLWAPGKLANQLAVVRGSDRIWACSGSISVTDTLRIVAGTPPPSAEILSRDLPFRNCVPAGASNVIVHRDELARAGLFDEGLRHMADWDLWIRLGALGLPALVAEPDVAYRLHAANASADAEQIEREVSVIEERYAVLRGGAPVDRAFALRWAAWNLLRVGRRGAAARTYGRAVAEGDLASVARAVVAILDPGIVERTLRRELDSEWAARAAMWLSHV